MTTQAQATRTPAQQAAVDAGLPANLLRTASPVAATPAPSAPAADVELARVTNTATKGKSKTAKATTAKTPKAPRKAKVAKPVVAETEDEGDEESPRLPRSIVPARFKATYKPFNDTCGDRVALALKAYTTAKNADGRDSLVVEKLWEVATANGIDVVKYKDLNNGQKRMNVSNKLRGMLKAGQKVTIGKQVFANAEKALAKQPAPTAPVAQAEATTPAAA